VAAGALRRAAGIVVSLAVLAFLAAVPTLSWDTHGVFSSPLDSPGTLTLLGLCLIFAGVAMSYDLLFGHTGLLSFGHALYFALGVYVMAIALDRWELWQAVLATIAVGIVLPIVVGSVSLRVSGIAFAMVTLAFAQAGTVLVQKNPNNLTGGEEGLPLAYEKLPSALVGVVNTKHLYWLALAYLVFVVLVVRWSLASSPGHVWRAIRENEQRVEVIGLRPFAFKLLSFSIASVLATLGGIVYLLLLGTGASPQVVSASFTLSLLVMVVIGGTGTLWGPILGAFLYTFLDQRLPAFVEHERIQDLPSVLRTPLSEPLFVLGVLFMLIVFFLPGGLAGLGGRGRRRGLRLLEQRVGREAEAGA
jgi:branched-chain amino acid transport system permease protein